MSANTDFLREWLDDDSNPWEPAVATALADPDPAIDALLAGCEAHDTLSLADDFPAPVQDLAIPARRWRCLHAIAIVSDLFECVPPEAMAGLDDDGFAWFLGQMEEELPYYEPENIAAWLTSPRLGDDRVARYLDDLIMPGERDEERVAARLVKQGMDVWTRRGEPDRADALLRRYAGDMDPAKLGEAFGEPFVLQLARRAARDGELGRDPESDERVWTQVVGLLGGRTSPEAAGTLVQIAVDGDPESWMTSDLLMKAWGANPAAALPWFVQLWVTGRFDRVDQGSGVVVIESLRRDPEAALRAMLAPLPRVRGDGMTDPADLDEDGAVDLVEQLADGMGAELREELARGAEALDLQELADALREE